MSKLRLYNSLTNRKEDFSPIDDSNVRVYTCGPTVYNYAHIGNARPPLVSDILVKLLKYLYSNVLYVSNITDIDDKIIAASIDQNIPIKELTSKYEKIYNENLKDLGNSFEEQLNDFYAEQIFEDWAGFAAARDAAKYKYKDYFRRSDSYSFENFIKTNLMKY